MCRQAKKKAMNRNDHPKHEKCQCFSPLSSLARTCLICDTNLCTREKSKKKSPHFLSPIPKIAFRSSNLPIICSNKPNEREGISSWNLEFPFNTSWTRQLNTTFKIFGVIRENQLKRNKQKSIQRENLKRTPNERIKLT